MNKEEMQIFISLKPGLLRKGRHMLGSAEEAEDVYQKTYLKLMKNKDLKMANVGGYITTSYLNNCKNQFKRVKMLEKLTESYTQVSSQQHYEPKIAEWHLQAGQNFEAAEILRYFKAAKPRALTQYKVLALVKKGFTYEQISAKLNMPYNTVKANYRFAQQFLKDKRTEIANFRPGAQNA